MTNNQGPDDPEIYYIPGAANQYDFDNNVIILDTELRNYPKAHDVIKSHEQAHAQARNTVDHLRLEFRTDLRTYFSSDAEIEEVRQYYEEREPRTPVSRLTYLGFIFANQLRMLWSMIMQPTGRVYRLIQNRIIKTKLFKKAE